MRSACGDRSCRSRTGGPRHRPPGVQLSNESESLPERPFGNAPVETRTNNPGSPSRRSAPRSTDKPVEPPGPLRKGCPAVSSCRSPWGRRPAAPARGYTSSSPVRAGAALGTPPRQALRRPRCSSHQDPRNPCWPLRASRPSPARPSGRCGRRAHRTETSVPAWPCGPASISARRACRGRPSQARIPLP